MNIFNLSFGKDSMATLIIAAEQGIPIDRVMYCDIRFSPELSGEHPLMAAWIPTAERRLKELFGVTVDHAYSGVSFYEQFYKVKQHGGNVGELYGFPHILSPWCNSLLKIRAINRYTRNLDNTTTFVGIAYDEPVRWERMKAKETATRKYRSLLVEQNLTEQDALKNISKALRNLKLLDEDKNENRTQPLLQHGLHRRYAAYGTARDKSRLSFD